MAAVDEGSCCQRRDDIVAFLLSLGADPDKEFETGTEKKQKIDEMEGIAVDVGYFIKRARDENVYQ